MQVDTFCDRIAPYVTESDDNEDGGEFWPLVKKVSIRIPECKVCRDGIVLVDLPGARDSNAARDIIAQEVGMIMCCHDKRKKRMQQQQ